MRFTSNPWQKFGSARSLGCCIIVSADCFPHLSSGDDTKAGMAVPAECRWLPLVHISDSPADAYAPSIPICR